MCRQSFEGISSHIKFLRQKISEVKLNPIDILEGEDESFLKKEEIKAKRKILEMKFQDKDKSIWMINTPKKLRYNHAMRGHWNLFATDPLPYAESIEKSYSASGYYSEDQSFILQEKLHKKIDKHEKGASLPELFAFYMAFLGVVIEKMEMVNDSYGVIGQIYGEIFEKYYQLDLTKLDMSAEDFYSDLMELIIWEDYGSIDERKPDFRQTITPNNVSVVESILQRERAELKGNKLEYHVKKTVTMLGILYAHCKLFDKFIPIAKEMTAHDCYGITILAETAENNKKLDIALSVYEACLQSDRNYDFLQEKYLKLKKRLQTS